MLKLAYLVLCFLFSQAWTPIYSTVNNQFGHVKRQSTWGHRHGLDDDDDEQKHIAQRHTTYKAGIAAAVALMQSKHQ